jgi:hypothetical protein
MSATGRGGIRRRDDFYETPEWCTRAILRALKPQPETILEPSAGHGAIIRVLRDNAWNTIARPRIVAVEIRPEARMHLAAAGADVHCCEDFLTWEPGTPLKYDLLIGNPPFSLAFEFCQRAIGMAHTVALLLRLNFLGSQKRAAWMRAHTPSVFVLPRRPSFTGKGTDATEYAWFVWGDNLPTVNILEVKP